MKKLQLFAAGFVLLSIVIGLSIQEVSQQDWTIAEVPEIVEEGGKIIDVELSDGIAGTTIQGKK